MAGPYTLAPVWVLYEKAGAEGYLPVAGKAVYVDGDLDGERAFLPCVTDERGRLWSKPEGKPTARPLFAVEGSAHQLVVAALDAVGLEDDALRAALQEGRLLGSAQLGLTALAAGEVGALGFAEEELAHDPRFQQALRARKATADALLEARAALGHAEREAARAQRAIASLEALLASKTRPGKVALLELKSGERVCGQCRLRDGDLTVWYPTAARLVQRRTIPGDEVAGRASIGVERAREQWTKDLAAFRATRATQEAARAEHASRVASLGARAATEGQQLSALRKHPVRAFVLPRRHPLRLLWPAKPGAEDPPGPVTERFVYWPKDRSYVELRADADGRLWPVRADGTPRAEPLWEPWLPFDQAPAVIVAHRRLTPSDQPCWLQRRGRFERVDGALHYRLEPSLEADLPAHPPLLEGDAGELFKQIAFRRPAGNPNEAAERTRLAQLFAGMQALPDADFRDLLVCCLSWATAEGDTPSPGRRLEHLWLHKCLDGNPFAERFRALEAALEREGDEATLARFGRFAELVALDFRCVLRLEISGAPREELTWTREGIAADGDYQAPIPCEESLWLQHYDPPDEKRVRYWLLHPRAADYDGVWQLCATGPGSEVRVHGDRWWTVEAPEPPPDKPFATTLKMSFRPRAVALAEKWAPLLFFAAGEQYFPRSVFAHLHTAYRGRPDELLREVTEAAGKLLPQAFEGSTLGMHRPCHERESFSRTVYVNAGKDAKGREFAQFFFYYLDSRPTAKRHSGELTDQTGPDHLPYIDVGLHEGDWELVLYEDDALGGYSVHACHLSAMARPTKDLLTLGDDTRRLPLIFVTSRGHGSYPMPSVALWNTTSVYRDPISNAGLGTTDWATGELACWAPRAQASGPALVREAQLYSLELIDEHTPWNGFAGKWGKDAGSCAGPLYRTTIGDLKEDVPCGHTSSQPTNCDGPACDVPRVWADAVSSHRGWRDFAMAMGDLSLLARRSPSDEAKVEVFYYLHGWATSLRLASWGKNTTPGSLVSGGLWETISGRSALKPGWHWKLVDAAPYLYDGAVVSLQMEAHVRGPHSTESTFNYAFRSDRVDAELAELIMNKLLFRKP